MTQEISRCGAMTAKQIEFGKRQNRISRRSFLNGTAAATTAFAVVPHSVLGGQGKTPPSRGQERRLI